MFRRESRLLPGEEGLWPLLDETFAKTLRSQLEPIWHRHPPPHPDHSKQAVSNIHCNQPGPSATPLQARPATLSIASFLPDADSLESHRST